MKKLKLSNGYYTLVDDEDFEELSKYNWHYKPTKKSRNTGYVIRNSTVYERKKLKYPWDIRLHRQIMNVIKTKEIIDHKDRNGLNNQRNNLRKCNTSENTINSISYLPNKTSKYRGVYYKKDRNKYVCKIVKNRKSIYLGSFINEEDAAKVYDAKAIELHGEFALLNFKREDYD